MLQRSRNVLHVTWRSCSNVSGTSCKLLEDDVTTYQEHLASYLKKMLQRIRDVLQVTSRRVTTYQEHLASYLKKMLQRSRNVLQVSCVCTGTWMLLLHPTPPVADHERAVQRLCLQDSKKNDEVAVPHPTAPHPTPPVTDHERAVQCLCLQDSKKNDEVAVPVCAQEHERYYPTPPHPTSPHHTPPHPTPPHR